MHRFAKDALTCRGERDKSLGSYQLLTALQAGSILCSSALLAADLAFPLQMAEVVWGDGAKTQRIVFPLDNTREFGAKTFNWKLESPGWKWARLAVWDAAGNGAFTNPSWK
jgi:hypothetical protein